MDKDAVLAWVESPLQLVGAAEWAAAARRRVPVAGRLTPQISATADELLARGAWFGALEPYLGIPWSLLARHDHWLVGDGFSGQFRLAASVLRPKRITFLDDGANTVAFAGSLLGARPYARPGVAERGLTTLLRPFALEKVMRLARRHGVDFFTAFDLGSRQSDDLVDRGIGIRPHAFEWTRASAPAPVKLGTRITLGSARPVDGRMPLTRYLHWVAATAAEGPVTYLPHRRETDTQLEEVARVSGVTVVHSDLPVELVLAGTRVPLEIFTLPSSTTSTLPLVLAGTGSSLRTGRMQTRVGS